jgi:putative transposase
VRHAQRAEIILLAFGGMLNIDIANRVDLDRLQVGLWRRRWVASIDALVAIECRENNAELTRMIQQVLSDAPRSGSPGTFTGEQVTQILALACESPENSARPVLKWTSRGTFTIPSKRIPTRDGSS